MNLAIHSIEANLSSRPADTFLQPQHPDLKADFVLANPPFNVSDWGGKLLEKDVRWQFGTPPAGNANCAWIQHFIHHLAPPNGTGVPPTPKVTAKTLPLPRLGRGQDRAAGHQDGLKAVCFGLLQCQGKIAV